MSSINWQNRVGMVCFTLLDKSFKNEKKKEKILTNTYFVLGAAFLPKE